MKICSTAAAADNQTSSNAVETLTNSASESLIEPNVHETIPSESYVVVEEGSKKWVAYVDHRDEEFGDYHI